jgi:hypothetical protein
LARYKIRTPGNDFQRRQEEVRDPGTELNSTMINSDPSTWNTKDKSHLPGICMSEYPEENIQ